MVIEVACSNYPTLIYESLGGCQTERAIVAMSRQSGEAFKSIVNGEHAAIERMMGVLIVVLQQLQMQNGEQRSALSLTPEWSTTYAVVCAAVVLAFSSLQG